MQHETRESDKLLSVIGQIFGKKPRTPNFFFFAGVNGGNGPTGEAVKLGVAGRARQRSAEAEGVEGGACAALDRDIRARRRGGRIWRG